MYIEDDAYQITELRDDTVQLLPTGMAYPIYRAERKEQFEQLLRADRRNAYYTEFLPVDPDKADQDLRDVLVHGLMDEADKQQISTLLQSGRSNSEIAYWLSRAYSGEIETLNLQTGDIADYRTTAQGLSLIHISHVLTAWGFIFERRAYEQRNQHPHRHPYRFPSDRTRYTACLLYTSYSEERRRAASEAAKANASNLTRSVV